MYNCMFMFIWKKRMFLIEKYFSELVWIYNVGIYVTDSGIRVCGDGEDVVGCMCCIEGLLLGWKGGENE